MRFQEAAGPDFTQPAPVAAPMQRARGAVSLAAAATGGRTAIADLAQAGCGRLLFPARPAAAPLEAVIVNTGGGLTGGDRFSVAIAAGPGSRIVATTQACEKIYRAAGEEPARTETTLTLDAASGLAWLPQETILFDRARLHRRLDVAMAPDATFLAVEAVLLGRRASGETLTDIDFRDRWRIRRGGALVFADETALSGNPSALLAAAAGLAGAGAFALALCVAPDAEARAAAARDVLTIAAADGGVSTWDGLCVARLVAQDGAMLRRTLGPLLAALGAATPRVWTL